MSSLAEETAAVLSGQPLLVRAARAMDVPPLSDQALYLINELACVLERTNLAYWPERKARIFRRRLGEINAAIDDYGISGDAGG